jgi:hypothetical protein
MISITACNTASDPGVVTLRDGIVVEDFATAYRRNITIVDNKSGIRSGCGFFGAGFVNLLDDPH